MGTQDNWRFMGHTIYQKNRGERKQVPGEDDEQYSIADCVQWHFFKTELDMFAQVVRDREGKPYDTTTFDRIFCFVSFVSLLHIFFCSWITQRKSRITWQNENFLFLQLKQSSGGKIEINNKSTRNNWAKSTDGGILFTQDRPKKRGPLDIIKMGLESMKQKMKFLKFPV